MNITTPVNKRLILLPPDKELLSLISFKRPRRKIYLSRPEFDYNPSYIVLNEWGDIKFLRYLFAIPLMAFGAVYSIFILIVSLIAYLIKKDYFQEVSEYLLEILSFIASRGPKFQIFHIQPYADSLIKEASLSLNRILYVHVSQKKLLFKINPEKARSYINQIWVYDKPDELLEKIEMASFSKKESFIVDYDNLINNNIWKEIKKKKTTDSLTWISNINFDHIKIRPKSRGEQFQNSQSIRITLKPNDFLNNDVVFYFEPTYNKNVNEFLSKHYDRINKELEKRGMWFYYIPSLRHSNVMPLANDYLRYKYPGIFKDSNLSDNNWARELFANFDLAKYYDIISESLGFSDINSPCLIHSREVETGISERRNYSYSVYYLKGQTEDDITAEIQNYLYYVRRPGYDIQYRLVAPDNEDPDDMFTSVGQHISKELKDVIQKLKGNNNDRVLVDSIIYMVRSLKDVKPELCKDLSQVLYNSITKETKALSRLKVDEQFRIFLPDYNNIEIQLTPLPKTLYLFLLQNPDGVKLKELYNHREELIKIYSRVGNRTDMDVVRKNILELTDARSNSINEKCSRIKEAFLSQIDDSIACQYYITGNRSENKRITLDRSLVEFSEIK